MLLALIAGGCVFDERSFPMRPGDLVRLDNGSMSSQAAVGNGDGPNRIANTREWLASAHRGLEHLLTDRGRRVMLTGQMADDRGRAPDVYRYFDKDPTTLMTLRYNWYSILHTAQTVSRRSVLEEPEPPWPGFRSEWIPVADGIEAHGRLGFAEGADARPCEADCIVILPGYLGDNAVLRTRDLAIALRAAGYHVLALEIRAHGQVELRYPDEYYTFGVLETQDLLRISEHLEDRYACVRRTGLVGYCWGGNLAMLAAWFDGRGIDDPSITPRLAMYLDPPSTRVHYAAGVIAFSPVLRWEDLTDRCDFPHVLETDPATTMFQETIRGRMARKQYAEVSGNLRQLIDYEFGRSRLGWTFPVCDGYRFLRLLPYRDQPAGDKLERARVPVLMVGSANEPLLSAQDIPDLVAQTENPNVAAVVLRGGGHIGFAAYNRAYYYSLIVNFFDPEVGAAAATRPAG